ncbi:MAG: 23S rRNA (guanosine(2251)-2'-O)-methyltransferase RlmB [Erysipelotrichaceae bacterium]|nr:23S rRNA (guanosine(2251)-2'-O)-methyltransferase RlmB [Erysipelotrichaceae bacterium]
MLEKVYGRNLVAETLKLGRVRKVWCLPGHPFLKEVKEAKIPYEIVDRRKLDQFSHSGNHQGIVAEAEAYPLYEVEDMLKEKDGLLIILDGLKDPQNLGAILRTVDCAGADGVIFKKHNSVKLNATAAKVSCGAIEYVKAAEVTNLVQTIKKLKEKGYWILAADAGGTSAYDEMKYDMNIALVIGAEGEGISRLVKEQCDFVVSLPMKGHLDSLNASVAAGILIYQIVSERAHRG